MNTRMQIAIAGILATPVLILGVTSAQESPAQPQAQQPNGQNQNSTLQQRLEERKNRRQVSLNQFEQSVLAQRCKPAQPLLKNLGDKVRSNVPQRHKAYEALNTHLTALAEKLEAKNVDTGTLKQQQAALNEKITVYKTDIANYQQALDDLVAMDCAADPVAFKASLEEARALRENLSKTITEIRTYVMETIKPTLVAIRTSLASGNTAEGEE
jgi:chromosome segregation ATPase